MSVDGVAETFLLDETTSHLYFCILKMAVGNIMWFCLVPIMVTFAVGI